MQTFQYSMQNTHETEVFINLCDFHRSIKTNCEAC